MILVDTSIWIDHLHNADPTLERRLNEGRVVTHPLVIEELACGQIKGRRELIGMLHSLPRVPIARHLELMELIENRDLYGVGLGAIDVHLIASTMLAKAKIWSRDKALSREAKRLGVAA
jgi:predicted nucleic acid-binding protein